MLLAKNLNTLYEYDINLIESDVFHDVDGVFVERAADEFEVWEDEGLVHVEAEGDDVFGVLECQPLGLFLGQILEQKLFVVGQLDHQLNVKGILEPSVEIFFWN